jgi:hypothetical protein
MQQQLMKQKHGYGGEGSSLEKNTPQVEPGFEQNQNLGTPDTLPLPMSPFQSCWWETVWFKQWERVARREG